MSDQESEDALAELRKQLGGRLPEGVRRLDPEQVAQLTLSIREARHRQAQALAAAGERALGHIPRLLRGPIRKVVG